ncbi:MAG: transcription termination/antitermination protein NusG [Deltaproteobacteria bacterium]|nr:transcription termination/antitermination protein NusG [Deltaproteobacteria bacterium]
MKWYVVHTYSGHENRAKYSLAERIKAAGLQDYFGEILLPTESVVEVRKGQKRTSSRRFYPGYLFVQMILNKETWHLVKATPKITGFLGGQNPSPVPEREITKITEQVAEGTARPQAKISLEENDSVRVTDGPFSGFSGVVEKVMPEKQKVRVLVSIFGRSAPVELDFVQVEKA